MSDNRPTEVLLAAPAETVSETAPMAAEGVERLPWNAPELREFGAVTLLTAGAGALAGDGGNNLS